MWHLQEKHPNRRFNGRRPFINNSSRSNDYSRNNRVGGGRRLPLSQPRYDRQPSFNQNPIDVSQGIQSHTENGLQSTSFVDVSSLLQRAQVMKRSGVEASNNSTKNESAVDPVTGMGPHSKMCSVAK